MSRSVKSSAANVIQEGLHHTQGDGKLTKAFNPNTGKWETSSTQQNLAFDPQTGKLIVVVQETSSLHDIDSSLTPAIRMAAAGFFISLDGLTMAGIVTVGRY